MAEIAEIAEMDRRVERASRMRKKFLSTWSSFYPTGLTLSCRILVAMRQECDNKESRMSKRFSSSIKHA
jgi:hypothetical protein